MPSTIQQVNEQLAAGAFSKQSAIFDELYAGNTIVQYKRERVRAHVERYLTPGSHILELNAGTGEDALYFASRGFRVHATDISIGMQEVLAGKVQAAGATDHITQEVCSFTSLENMTRKGPYDLIFSNFAGLNCTDELDKVLRSFGPLLKPGGVVTLVVLPRCCLWETMLVLKGKFSTAFRRFSAGRGVTAHIEGEYFKCWYYDPSYITKRLRHSFSVLSMEGLCTLVPPSYIEHFAERYPKVYRWLVKLESRWKSRWPWRSIGDYYIISLKRS